MEDHSPQHLGCRSNPLRKDSNSKVKIGHWSLSLLTRVPGSDNYEQILPEDTYGEELGPNARVFKVYNEESAIYDKEMVVKSGESCDVLLVFVCAVLRIYLIDD